MYRINKNFVDYLYNRLPSVYRTSDKKQEFQLKRYLASVIEGGFLPMLNKILDVTNLVDPEKCPSGYLPLLCQSFGVEYFPDIEESFQRKFLRNFIELNRRKGTASCIEYLVRELSGYNVTVKLEGDEVVLVGITAYEDDINLLTNQQVIEKYISNYIPVDYTASILTSYYYIDDGDFISQSTDEDTLSVITTITDYTNEPTIRCIEEVSSDIMKSLGTESYEFRVFGDEVTRLTNSRLVTPDWFISNSYAGVDIVTQFGVHYPIIIYN